MTFTFNKSSYFDTNLREGAHLSIITKDEQVSSLRRPPPRKDEIKMIDFSGIQIYLVICLAIITLNKHSTYCIGGVYAIGVHITP